MRLNYNLFVITMLALRQFGLTFRRISFNDRHILRTKVTKLFTISRPKPEDIEIPLDKIEFKACRSSGPGGQNVNKLNTKVEVRFNITEADWIPNEVKERLVQYYPTKISKDGDLIVTSQEDRYASWLLNLSLIIFTTSI